MQSTSVLDYIKLGCKHNCIDVDDAELKNAVNITNDPNNPDSNNGLITSIWGPHAWESFHSITFGYPIRPSDNQKNDYLNYFITLGKVLPCKYCRESYDKFIKQADTILDINTMQSREALTRWGHRLHDAVNRKLGVDYGVTYEELCYKYESYRAKCTNVTKGCMMPISMKAKSYQKAEIRRAPIIDVKYSRSLSDHADTLGLKNYSIFVDIFSNAKRNSELWMSRDYACRKIIIHMRKNGISSLDQNELPTELEMILISMLSTTLDHDKLERLYKNITSDISPLKI